ncbi:hypothetical protein EJ06DRAFT_202302 [Trichodelitschia bisporula]|uniref:D-lactate dehydrogenase n=1 Tax=Trichodelitschia bisporula TaxID=703511 RepID=A0A6G1I7Y4_9PEZI|nr:hypothetical protein EJ06DRAFT_202302 [Trichodelitschia bisporula]
MPKLAVFSVQPHDKKFLELVRGEKHPSLEVTYHTFALNTETAILAADNEAVCVFVNDVLNADVLTALVGHGVRAVLLRCAGYNNVDLVAAEALGLFVANVPSYSPAAVAEFAVALIQTLNRKTHRAFNRVREGNFNLEGLLGFTIRGKTVGIVGTGKIGVAFAHIMRGFGCRLLAYDPYPAAELESFVEFMELEQVLGQSDIISLHCPLIESTWHIINEKTLSQMKKGAMLVNTSRGGLIDTNAVVASLKAQHLGGLALDVYEAEAAVFYGDHSGEIIHDDVLMRLLTFPNVIICGHQAFFTEEALEEISGTTLHNLEDFLQGQPCPNSLLKNGHLLVRRDSHPVRV